jgi:hypothetical protein
LRRALADPKLNPLGIVARKLSAIAYRGLPDYMLLCPGGHIFFVELKRPGGKTTTLQEAEHRTLRALGFKVYVTSEPAYTIRHITATLIAHGYAK